MIVAFLLSFIIGFAFLVSGLARRINVIRGFSFVGGYWTPVLLIAMAVIIGTCFILFLLMGNTA